jgi:hypothetical protein
MKKYNKNTCIILTSFAPSPIAKVMSLVRDLINSTICALFFGVARQAITVQHETDKSRNMSLQSLLINISNDLPSIIKAIGFSFPRLATLKFSRFFFNSSLSFLNFC